VSPAPAIAFVTLGCPKNEVDSDHMAAAVAASAYRLVESPEDADVVVLNTCAFIQAATEESIAETFMLLREWRPARPGRRLIVAGCLPARYGDELRESLHEPDAFLPVAREGELLDVVSDLTGIPAQSHPGPSRTRPDHTAYLKISEGCDRGCAYCTIPAIRGRFVSVPADVVIEEARFLIKGGVRELVLVGQDIARYGAGPVPAPSLAELVAELDRLHDDFRLRLMYLQPDGITDELLAVMAASKHVCHYLDVPLQHASGAVLSAMRRSGDAASHAALLTRVRSALPEVVLRTTVMAGFPGETDADHEILADFLREARFDYVGVFSYSAEEGTVAATKAHQVPDDVKLTRAQELRDIADEVGFAQTAAYVGSVQHVLIEGEDENGELIGRSCGQAPEVDGLVIVEGEAPRGEFIDVRITESIGYDMVGVPA